MGDPKYGTLNSRILIKVPQNKVPYFSETPIQMPAQGGQAWEIHTKYPHRDP